MYSKLNTMDKIELNKYAIDNWTKTAKEVLEGRTIVEVRYLTDEEMEVMGWYKRPICFQLDNGTLCIPQMDDEGNDGGSLFYQNFIEREGVKFENQDVLPVI